MQHTSLENSSCPVARSLEHVGEWWSILILRDAFAGKTRFDDFKTSLGIAPNMLARRLETLVEAGMFRRSVYSAKPLRHEYLLTDRGRDFHTVLVSLFAFGSRHFPRDGQCTGIADGRTGEFIQPVLVDGKSKRLLTTSRYRVVGDPSMTSWVLGQPKIKSSRPSHSSGGAHE